MKRVIVVRPPQVECQNYTKPAESDPWSVDLAREISSGGERQLGALVQELSRLVRKPIYHPILSSSMIRCKQTAKALTGVGVSGIKELEELLPPSPETEEAVIWRRICAHGGENLPLRMRLQGEERRKFLDKHGCRAWNAVTAEIAKTAAHHVGLIVGHSPLIQAMLLQGLPEGSPHRVGVKGWCLHEGEGFDLKIHKGVIEDLRLIELCPI